MSSRSAFARDFLLAAAAVGASLIGSPLVGAELWAAFASRTALVLGVQTYARAEQRKAARRAAAGRGGPTDNTVTLAADDYPECIVYGTARVPLIRAYRCTHGASKQFLTQVLIVPCRHELTAIDDILFDGKSIGPLDANGYVQSGSKWFTDTVSAQFKQQTGGPISTTVTLAHTAGQIVAVDSVAIASTETLTSGSGEGSASWRDASLDRVLAAGTEYTVSGNVVTLLVATTGLQVTVTYRARTGGKAWVRVRKNLGLAAGGTFDVDGAGTTLITASAGEWTANDKLCGIPGIVLTLEYDPTGTVWASGPPQVTLVVRGAKLYDPTKDSTNGGSGAHRLADPATWEFTNNAALCWRDYMRREVGCDATELDDSSTRAAVPICDVLVTLRAGGTEKAFTVDGVISTADTWATNIERLAVAMIGNAFVVGAKWSIEPYSWTTPVVTLPESATTEGEIEIDSRPGLDEIINCVRGKCLDDRVTADLPYGVLTMVDFPPREITAYVTEDEGRKYWHDVEFPLSRGFERGQRMATFYAHRARQSMIAKIPFSNEAFDGLVPGKRIRLPWDITSWNFTQDGGTGKVFQILERTTEPPGKVVLSVKEDAQAIYSWDYTAATLVDPSPNSAFPPPNYVATPDVTAVVSDATTFIRRADGTIVGYVAFRFTRPAQDDVNVVLYWKRTSEGAWREVRGRVGDTELRAEGVVADEVLNAYLIAFNGLGAQSTPAWLPTVVVGSAVPSSSVITVENELKGVTFEYGIGDAVGKGVGIADSLVVVQKHPSAGYFVPGPEGSARLVAITTASGTGQSARWYFPRVPVYGGQLYALYASLLPWECSGHVAVEWLDAAGTYLDANGTDLIAGVPHESASRRPDNPAHYQLTGELYTAPAAARLADVSIRAVGSWSSYAEKNVWARRPFFARVPPWLRQLPPWNAGPVSMVGTNFLAPNSVTGLYSDRKTGGNFPWIANQDVTPFHPELPAVWIPSNAEIESGTTLRVHVTVNVAFTGKAGAGQLSDITASVGLVERVVDAAGARQEISIGSVQPIEGETYTAGMTYSGSTAGIGYLFDQHLSAPRLMDGVTLIGTLTTSFNYRWIKGVGRRFGLLVNFDTRMFPFPSRSNWQLSIAGPCSMSVEAIKR